MPTDFFSLLSTYTEETESPRDFWLWAGIYVLASTLQRRTWLPYGIYTIFPNLYVMLAAPPGICRKSAPVKLIRSLFRPLDLPAMVDSCTTRVLTQHMAEQCTSQHFVWKGETVPMATTNIVSAELSSFLSKGPKEMTELLTDLWDSPSFWEYRTKGQGSDVLENVCLSGFFATTPAWISVNLPAEAIGGGFTSRVVIIAASQREKDVAIPPEPDEEVFSQMLAYLEKVKTLQGPFQWGKETEEYFRNWYGTIRKLQQKTSDVRLHGFLSRIHIIALKVAMALHVGRDLSLVLEKKDLHDAILLLEKALTTMSFAFSGHGRALHSTGIFEIREQCKNEKETTYRELLTNNWTNIDRADLQNIIDTLSEMGDVKIVYEGNKQRIIWKGGEG